MRNILKRRVFIMKGTSLVSAIVLIACGALGLASISAIDWRVHKFSLSATSPIVTSGVDPEFTPFVQKFSQLSKSPIGALSAPNADAATNGTLTFKVWMGLFKAKMSMNDFVFEMDWSDLRRFTPSFNVPRYDLAGRITMGIIIGAVYVNIAAFALCLVAASQDSSRVTTFVAAMTCFATGTIYIVGAVVWAVRAPSTLFREWSKDSDQYSYSHCFHMTIAAGVLAVLCGAALVFRWYLKGKDPTSGHRAADDEERRLRPGVMNRVNVVPIISLLVGITAAILVVLAMSMIDFEEQYYQRPKQDPCQPSPTPSADSQIAKLGMENVAVFIGLLKVRIERGSWTFETDWSKMNHPILTHDEHRKSVNDKYGSAGWAGFALCLLALICIALFLVVTATGITGQNRSSRSGAGLEPGLLPECSCSWGW